MKKILVMVGTTIGSGVGWWIGRHIGMMTAFFLSMVGTGVGMYAAVKFARDYTP